MAERVKPRRAYQSQRRREQAAATRRSIITAAGTLFRDRGYGVPLASIAAEAGVVVETIYRIFGTKAVLFRAVVEALLAGGPTRAEVPVAERPAIRAIHDEPDPRCQVALYAATQPGIHRRAGPLLRALRDARASDPDLGRLWDELKAWRFAGQGRFVAVLAEGGALRADLTVPEAIDILWTLCSLAVYDLLVTERGWTSQRYQAWLTAVLIGELLARP
jgi:AcrR family transcriptional regulator